MADNVKFQLVLMWNNVKKSICRCYKLYYVCINS